MEQPQQQQVNLNNHEEMVNGGGSNKSGGGGGNYLCRQTSTRWTPTTDQIRILKDLYYNHGVRSPNAEQIQKISAKLRQYGKIEGKNVFYWFQNHKARERQKKRFTNEQQQQQLSLHQQRSCGLSNTAPWRSIPAPPGGFQSPSSSSSSSTSSAAAGMVAGQMGTCGYGSVPMEKSFRDWSISAAGGGGCSGGRPIGHNFWAAGVDQYHHHQFYPLFDAIDEAEEDQQQNHHHELETLPLFPMHGQDIHGGGGNGGGYCSFKTDSNYYSGGWYHRSDVDHHRKAAAAASLELTLSSFAAMSRD